MKTNELIDLLSADPSPAPDRSRFWPIAVGAGLIGAFALLVVTLGVRADLMEALTPTALKMLVSTLVAMAGVSLVSTLSQPVARFGATAWISIGLLSVSVIVALSAGLNGIGRLQDAQLLPRCLVFVPLYAIPSALLIGWIVRGMAPTRPAFTGAACGAAAGGIGAIAYSMWCPYDSTLYFTLSFYVLSIAICAGIGAVAGWRLLRW